MNGRQVSWILFLIALVLVGNRISPGRTKISNNSRASDIQLTDWLQNTSFGDHSNLTGIYPPPVDISDRIHRLTISPESVVYQNLSGWYWGQWTRGHIQSHQPIQENITFTRNVTGESGRFNLKVHQDDRSGGRFVQSVLSIKDYDGKSMEGISFFGLHFETIGKILMASYSPNFDGIIGLPMLAWDNQSFSAAKTIFLQHQDKIFKEAEDLSAFEDALASVPENGTQKCEYILYLQALPLNWLEAQHLQDLEKDLRFPTGVNNKLPRQFETSAILFSPNCGLVLEWNRQPAIKIEHYLAKLRHYAVYSVVLAITQLWLLLFQMDETDTPSTVSRVSSLTIGMHAIMDGYLFMMYLSASVFGAVTSLGFLTSSFLNFLLVSVFGMRYIKVIRGIQWPEDHANQAARQSIENGPQPLPTPALAPIINNERRNQPDLSMLYTRFYFLLMTLTLVSIHAMSWSRSWRRRALRIVLLIMTSFWAPQIHRNIKRGCRHSLNWRYVIGISLVRIFNISYFLLCPSNILFADPDPLLAQAVAGWIWIQICILVSQKLLGARYLVPACMLTPTYDYHRPLPREDVEAMVLADQTPNNDQIQSTRQFHCAICMNTVTLPRMNTQAIDRPFTRQSYMVTPCMHVFHTKCLETWMRVKFQCPVCRNTLPPV